MESVSIKGNEEKQREIVKRLADILNERPLNEEDFNMLKTSVKELAELECGAYRIKLEFQENDETLPSLDNEEIDDEDIEDESPSIYNDEKILV